MLANLEKCNHDSPHRTQKSKERGKVRTGRQEAQVTVFGKAQAFNRALDRIFQERCTVLNGIVAHEVTELGGFFKHLGSEAPESAVVCSFTETLQFYELLHIHELAEKHHICTLVFLVHDILHNNNAPRTERHNGQNAQDDKGRNIGLRKHLE